MGDSVECSNHIQLERFELHLETIKEQLERCLKGIADIEDDLKASSQPKISGFASTDSFNLANSPGVPASDPLPLRDAETLTPSQPPSSIVDEALFNDENLLSTTPPGQVERIRRLMRLRRERSGHTMRRSSSNLHQMGKSTTLYGVIVAPSHTTQRHRNKFARELWKVLDEPGSSREATFSNLASSLLICLSVALTLLGSGTGPTLGFESVIIQLICDGVFSFEFLARFYSCPSRRVFLTDVSNLFEIVGAIPILAIRAQCSFDGPLEPDAWSYVVLFVFTPVLRLLMMIRRFEQIHLQVSAFRSAAEALPVMLYTLLMLIVGFAAILFVVEPRSNIPSYSDAIWLTMVTCYTVGYGDAYPVSTGGRCTVCFLMVCSALYMAIPIGIVGDAFSSVWADREALFLVRRMSRRLREAKIEAHNVASVFYQFDKEKNGAINRDEFLEIIRFMSVNLDDAQANQLFGIIDAEGIGEITDEDFVKLLFPSDFEQLYSAFNSVYGITKQVATSAINTATESAHRVSWASSADNSPNKQLNFSDSGNEEGSIHDV